VSARAVADETNAGDVANKSSTEYGKPSCNQNVAYQPRMPQIGFRLGISTAIHLM
jgi:hypothetical protein